jgi:uncharacterized YccA/Bax inhibitor family protein
MSIFKSDNPTFSQKIFDKSLTLEASAQGIMSVKGAMYKFGFLLLLVVAAASYPWSLIAEFGVLKMETVTTLLWVGLITGLVLAIAIIIKPNWAQYIAPAYALAEGLVLGALSAFVNYQIGAKNPGIVMQAVGLTFGVAIAIFLLYNFRIIKVTEKLRAVIYAATMGVGIFYLVYWVLWMFGVNLPFMSWNDASPLGIGLNLVVIAIAAFSLLTDLDRIEQGAQQGLPKFMEWYGAFGLLVTIVWLYIQILKLLSRLGNRN